MWTILRAVTGEKFLCKTEANLQQAAIERKPVMITEVYEVLSLNMNMPGGLMKRLTRITFMDFQERGPLPKMFVVPAGWYEPDQAFIEAQLQQMKRDMEQAAEQEKKIMEEIQRQQSPLAQVHMVPKMSPVDPRMRRR